ncbi:MAG: hypothetical protein JNJ85_16045 [Candidatus Kapabacteria bacterium]|nr:hypothetical protein [Candidatus Kapabacteria bacterium]
MFEIFKSKDIIIVNKNELISTMTRIAEILHNIGYHPQADAVKKPIEYLHLNDRDNFVRSLLSVDIWGGSGAAWEVGLFPSKQIEREFETYFIQLVELMQQCGIKNNKASSVAEFFKKNLEYGG